jgi:DNA-binding response OmpR family regulator
MNLRRKIEPDPAAPIYVLTVYGYGYKFGEETPD